jgi:hypothetical protein
MLANHKQEVTQVKGYGEIGEAVPNYYSKTKF